MTILHHLGNSIRELFLQAPLGFARALFILLPLTLLVWVLSLPRSETTPPGAKSRPGENLKIWGAASLLIQILIYSLRW